MKLSTQILLAFLVVITLSIADTYTNYLLSGKVEDNIKFLSKSEAVIRNSNKIHKTIIQMQSAFRGYLLTDDTSFLKLYYDGLSALPDYFKEQEDLIKFNKSQLLILDSIHSLHNRWIEYAAALIGTRKTIELSNKQNGNNDKLFKNNAKEQIGKKLNDLISSKFSDFDKSEYKIRNTHSSALILSIKRTHSFSFIFITLTVIVGICSAILLMRLISNRISSMVLVAENITKGDFSIVNDIRNDELTGLSRSLNIMSERLSKTIIDLENRNDELNKFAYVVSHDLKAPVRGIHNVIKWIEEDLGNELTPEMKKYLSLIPQRTERMESLINGLLDYARISEKNHPELLYTNILVKEICDEIVPREYHVEIGPLPNLYTEKLKLEQVFTNLISNSVKYTQQPNGKIFITCETLSEYYQFSVKDNGVGIDPEYHEKIFEIFQTLREKNEKESTGVGLAIVKKIINEYHGTIVVKSQVNRGAEFIFTWPKSKTN